jgi:hypothetical protein
MDIILISFSYREEAEKELVSHITYPGLNKLKKKPGMRYQRRGINEDGHVANFVETEQIVIFKVTTTNFFAHIIKIYSRRKKQTMWHLLYKHVDQVCTDIYLNMN